MRVLYLTLSSQRIPKESRHPSQYLMFQGIVHRLETWKWVTRKSESYVCWRMREIFGRVTRTGWPTLIALGMRWSPCHRLFCVTYSTNLEKKSHSCCQPIKCWLSKSKFKKYGPLRICKKHTQTRGSNEWKRERLAFSAFFVFGYCNQRQGRVARIASQMETECFVLLTWIEFLVKHNVVRNWSKHCIRENK